MESQYVFSQRSLNDYTANMNEEAKKEYLKKPWWEKEKKTAYCMMSASPNQSKVNSEKW